MVALVDQNETGVKAAMEEIRKAGGRALALAGDLRDDTFSREIVSATIREFGQIDCLRIHPGTPDPCVIDDMEGRDLSITLNLRSQLITTNAALSDMIGCGMELVTRWSVLFGGAQTGALRGSDDAFCRRP